MRDILAVITFKISEAILCNKLATWLGLQKVTPDGDQRSCAAPQNGVQV
jgi:hypothetical protein